MAKTIVTAVVLPFVLFFALISVHSGNSAPQKNADKQIESGNGTLQKMIVENGSVTMRLDLNGLNGSSSLVVRPVTLQFAAAANSFFPILVFNDRLRGLEPGSMALIASSGSLAFAEPAAGEAVPGYANLPAVLRASLKRLAVEKLPLGQGFDLAVRNSSTRFTFFNIQGQHYDYDAATQSLAITNGNCSSQESSLLHLAGPQTLIQRQEQSPSGPRCNRFRSLSLPTDILHRPSCRLCNMQSVQTRQLWCQAPM